MTTETETKITITVDDLQVETEPGKMVLEAALQAGIYVPYLCYHPGMKPFAACRMCMVQEEVEVEVERDGVKVKEIQLRPATASCTLPVREGMVIKTTTGAVRQIQEGVMEMIISEHPHGCLTCHRVDLCGPEDICQRHVSVNDRCVVCAKNERCELKDSVRFLGMELNSPLSYKTRGLEVDTGDPFYDRDYDLCIVCGTMRISGGEDPPSFDTHTATSSAHVTHNGMLNTNLLWMPDGTSGLVADAAESWEISADGKAWTFVLKDNVKFQTGYEPAYERDGTVLVAADVAYSVRKIMGLEDGVVSARSGWIKEFIDTSRADGGLEAVDDRTVKFHMREPLAALGDVMAILFSGMYPEGVTREMLQERPYGAGPFKLKEFQRGALWQYEKNPDYFKPGVPYLDEIHHVNIRGTEVSQSALITNQIDMTGGLPTLDNEPIYNRMADEGKIIVRPYTTSCRPQGVNMNATAPPFDDLRLRQAVNLAINREDYIAVVHRAPDRAVPALILDTNGIWGRTADEIWEMTGFARGDAKAAEIAEAKAIVAELFPDGLDIDMMTRDSSSYMRQGEFIAGELAKIGFKVNINIMNSAQLFPAAQALNYSIWAYWFCQTTLTPEEMYAGYFITGGSRNWLGYGEQDVDTKFFTMAAAATFEERHRLARELEDMILEDLPFAPLAVHNGARVYWSYLQDVPIPIGLQYMWPKRERIWRNDV